MLYSRRVGEDGGGGAGMAWVAGTGGLRIQVTVHGGKGGELVAELYGDVRAVGGRRRARG